MKPLFICQSNSFGLFFRLAQVLEQRFSCDKGLFVTSDRFFFEEFETLVGKIDRDRVLAEWDIAAMARAHPQAGSAVDFEARYGVSFWRVLTSDRRLITGWCSAFVQDYGARLSEAEMISRGHHACEAISGFFDRTKPSHVIGFNCVTYIEYIAYLEARARNIPIFNLRPVRILNYVVGDDFILDPPAAFQRHYKDPHYIPSAGALGAAKHFLESLHGGPMLYEGAVPLRKEDKKVATVKARPSFVRRLVQKLKRTNKGEADTHGPPPLSKTWRHRIAQPFRVRMMRTWTRRHCTSMAQLGTGSFAFFPLHTEPEVALLLYAPAYQNQLEVVRNVACSLPSHMKLVVKDHPIGHTRRKRGYYEKLLAIPNVVLADPSIDSKTLIDRCALVTTIVGSIGIEALVRKRPVLVLSPCATYRVLTDSPMLRYSTDLNALDKTIDDLLRNYRYDDDFMLRFLTANLEDAFPLNLYSVLLEKEGVTKGAHSGSYDDEVARLAERVVAWGKPRRTEGAGTQRDVGVERL